MLQAGILVQETSFCIYLREITHFSTRPAAVEHFLLAYQANEYEDPLASRNYH